MTTSRFSEIVYAGYSQFYRDIGWAPTDLFLGPSGYKAYREIGREQARIYDPKCTGESWMGMTVHKIEDDEIHIGTTSRIFVKQ